MRAHTFLTHDRKQKSKWVQKKREKGGWVNSSVVECT
jgi:hypothetical protein